MALSPEQKEELIKLAPEVLFGESLALHTYRQSGGPAEIFLRWTDGYHYEPLKNILSFCLANRVGINILGNGSHLLIPEQGLPGLVLQLATKHIEFFPGTFKKNPATIQVSAGDTISNLVSFALAFGLAGLEPFCGLSGTVGGATSRNDLCYQQQAFSDFVTKIWTIPLANPASENFYVRKDLDFSRKDASPFPEKQSPELIITIEMKLPQGNKQELAARAKIFLRERRAVSSQS